MLQGYLPAEPFQLGAAGFPCAGLPTFFGRKGRLTALVVLFAPARQHAISHLLFPADLRWPLVTLRELADHFQLEVPAKGSCLS